MGGRVIMIDVVMLSIMVYWMQLCHIPQATINKIDSIITNFLWCRVGTVRKFHRTGLKSISKFAQKGSVGIIETHRFNLSLLIMSIWRVFFEKGLWQKIMFGKYIK